MAKLSSVDTILVTDVQGRVTSVTPNVEATFGYRPDELVGWPVAELFPGDDTRAAMHELVSAGGVRTYLTTFPGLGGRWIPVSVSMSLLRDGDGTITGTVAVLKDRSEEAQVHSIDE